MLKTIVVDVTVNESKASLEEMENLLGSLDAKIDFVCTQNLQKPHTTTYIGKGLLIELSQYVKQNEIDLIVFNNDLSPLQIKNITDACDCLVYDRSMIILKIFELRASSLEAKLQVEIAYLKYMGTRLIDRDKNYEQVTSGGAGGVTNRGAGEKAIDIKKYLIRKAIKEKEVELETIAKKRKERRQKEDHIYPRVAIVGYTNAGKSTLMNNFIRLTETNKRSEVIEENKLFATLSTNTRLIKLDKSYPFLLTDTVGFISDLPTSLIKAFRSTLEEITDADLLVHVVDLSDSNYIENIRVTNETLNEIGVSNQIPMIYLFNKIDQVQGSFRPVLGENEMLVTLKDESYMKDVISLINDNISSFYAEIDLFIPYENLDDYYSIKNNEAIVSSKETELGYSCRVKISHKNLKKYSKYLVTKRN